MPLRCRVIVAARFLLALSVSVGLAIGIFRFLPRQLSVKTDVVGYPIHSNFNIDEYYRRYYLLVLFIPFATLALYHVFARALLRTPSVLPPTEPESTQPTPPERPSVWSQLPRALAVGATFGLGMAILAGRTGAAQWVSVIATAVAYATAVFGAAALVVRLGSSTTTQKAVSFLNAFATPFAFLCPYAVSRVSRVLVSSDQSIVEYRWMPLWAAAVGVFLLIAIIVPRLLRARELQDIQKVEADGILFICGSVVLWVCIASLPAPWGGFDSFHFGEFLAGGGLVEEGAFPWRDIVFIHGLLQDVLATYGGYGLFEGTGWGGLAGFTVLLIPAWWVTHYLLFVYLFRRSPIFLTALFVAVLSSTINDLAHPRMVAMPLILLGFASLLERATAGRAILFSVLLIGGNIITPELAFLVPACALVLVAFELSRYERSLGFFASFKRSTLTLATGIFLAGVWFLFLWHHNAACAFVDYYRVFVFDHRIAGGIPIGSNLKQPSFVVAMGLPPLAALTAFWYTVRVFPRRRQIPVPEWTMAALGIVTLIYYEKFLGRADGHVYHSLSVAFPFICYVLYRALGGLGTLLRWPHATQLVGCVLVLFAIGAPKVALPRLSRISEHYSISVPTRPALPTLGWAQSGMTEVVTRWAETERFLRTYLEPRDPIFDFSNQPALFHYLLGFRHASRYFHISMAIPERAQAQLVEDLKRTRPKIVVFSSREGLGNWDDISTPVRHYEVSRYLLEHYRPFALVNTQLFYARKDLSLEQRVQLKPPSHYFKSSEEGYMLSSPCDWRYAPFFLAEDRVLPHSLVFPGGAEPLVSAKIGITRVVRGVRFERNPMTKIELPPDLFLDRIVGLRIATSGARGREISISDQPPSGSSAASGSISYRLMKPGTVSLSVSSCPQWRLFKGQILYFRHDPDVRVESVDVLAEDAT